ncbi:LysR family transcriptional regulator [Streptomyces sp. NPDC018031]|uniref:LysR family transcriptional regulator n=1 Tax=Streptomyces sp. NPDC018031 TaxID=3365033 RepID=UPI003792A55A
MELDFRQLRVIKAVADRGTLTAAARELGMTQPSVSESLGRAERTVGGALFHRGVHGAQPTALGETVVAHAGTVLDALDRMTAAAARHRSGTLPALVRVGCTPGMLVAHLSVAVPQVTGSDVEVSTGADAARQLELLADLRVEAALLTHFPGPEETAAGVAGRAPEGSRIERAVVAVEPLFVAVAAAHRLARRQEVDLAELAGEPWCLPPGPPSELGGHLARACRAAGHEPVRRTADHTAALQLAELGRAVLPVLPGIRPRDGLVFLPLRGAPLRTTTTLYWHRDGPLSTGRLRELWAQLVCAQHEIVERPPAYRAWLDRHPDWRTTPPDMAATYRPYR